MEDTNQKKPGTLDKVITLGKTVLANPIVKSAFASLLASAITSKLKLKK